MTSMNLNKKTISDLDVWSKELEFQKERGSDFSRPFLCMVGVKIMNQVRNVRRLCLFADSDSEGTEIVRLKPLRSKTSVF